MAIEPSMIVNNIFENPLGIVAVAYTKVEQVQLYSLTSPWRISRQKYSRENKIKMIRVVSFRASLRIFQGK